jgi:hypothetical protein
MKENAILLTTLAARLEKAIHCDVGMQGLYTLIYGWRMKYHLIQEHTFHVRRAQSGEAYLTPSEAISFSSYCGYDLTRD